MTKSITTPKERKSVRLADIAAEAGVSRVTVSKVLFPNSANNTWVAKETAQRIQSIAKRLRYTPNLNAKQLAGEKSHLLGAVVDSFAPKVSYKILAHLERAAAAHGYRLIVAQMHDDVQPIEKYLKDFIGRGVEGVISMAHDYQLPEGTIDRLYQNIPNVVFVGHPVIEWADWVGIDTHSYHRAIVEHLVQTGRRRIALLLTEKISASSHNRSEGFLEQVKVFGLNTQECPIWIDDTCYRLISEPNPQTIEHDHLLKLMEANPVDAVVASNDLVAMYVIRTLQMCGIKVPEQVAVVGFDNSEMTNMTVPSITSVDMCPELIAEGVMELILSRIAEPARTPAKKMTGTRLVVRESTRASTLSFCDKTASSSA